MIFGQFRPRGAQAATTAQCVLCTHAFYKTRTMQPCTLTAPTSAVNAATSFFHETRPCKSGSGGLRFAISAPGGPTEACRRAAPPPPEGPARHAGLHLALGRAGMGGRGRCPVGVLNGPSLKFGRGRGLGGPRSAGWGRYHAATLRGPRVDALRVHTANVPCLWWICALTPQCAPTATPPHWTAPAVSGVGAVAVGGTHAPQPPAQTECSLYRPLRQPCRPHTGEHGVEYVC